MTYEIIEAVVRTGTWKFICMKVAVLFQVYKFFVWSNSVCYIKLA